MNARFITAIIALAGLVVVASTAAAPNGGVASSAAPRTLVIQNGKIFKFAQDGDYIAWIGGPQYKIHVRVAWTSGPGSLLGTAAPSKRAGYRRGPSAFTLGGKRAVWVNVAGGMSNEAAIRTAKPGEKRPMIIDTPTYSDYGGTYLMGLAADGEKTIVYGDALVRCNPLKDCGVWDLLGGGVHRFNGLKSYPPHVPAIPPPFTLAASQGRVAVVPAAMVDPSHEHVAAAPNGPVDVYDMSGSRVTHVVPEGTVRKVALSWPVLAVLVARESGTTAIERYDARTSKLLTATTAPGASALAVGTGGTVYLVGSQIYTIRDGKPALLLKSIGQPFALSIEGRRVAWAVNIGATGRIRALTLPK